MKQTISTWLTIIAVALTFASIQTNAETLEIQYRNSGNQPQTLEVEKDVGYLRFNNPYSISLPEGLTKLHTLEIISPYYLNQNRPSQGGGLKLPKDIGKDADWPFRLVIRSENTLDNLLVHKEMGAFELIHRPGNESSNYTAGVPTRIPSADKMIRNRTPENEGEFILHFRIDLASIIGARPHPHDWQARLGVGFINVYGVLPKISMTRKDGGIELSWQIGTLQSAPTINGPWTDVTFDETVRRLFLRTSSPTEFFRIKP